MQIQGKVTYVGPIESGTSKNGNSWRKQTIVVCYQEGQFPKSVAFDIFNDDTYIGKIPTGITVIVDFDIQTRDWTDKNGKLHKQNDVRIWQGGIHSVKNTQQVAQQAQAPQPATPQPQAQAPASQQPDESDNLPF